MFFLLYKTKTLVAYKRNYLSVDLLNLSVGLPNHTYELVD